MDASKDFIQIINDFGDITIFKLGKTTFSVSMLVFFILSSILLVYLSGKLKNLISNKVLARYHYDIGVRQAIGTIIRYLVLVVGFVIIIQTTGIDLSFLTVLAGALGVGVGFGLQNITNNFVSGIVILMERPIKVGDRIEVGDISGDVVKVSARATTVITNDNIAIIIPNSDFITHSVINWSYTDRNVRFNFKVPVSYKEDPEVVKRLLLEVARENDGVLNDPPPDVLFDTFGDNRLEFNLRIWTTRYIQRPGVLRSQLYYAIFKKFGEHGITIPYPQRDIHIKSGWETNK